MKKIFCVLALLALGIYLGWLPFKATDVAALLPAKTVIITRSGDSYVVDIGAGVKAVGKTLKEALSALRQEVSGEAFFQTAEQVIVTEQASEVIPQITEETAFRPAAGLYLTAQEGLDVEEVTEYLTAHHSDQTISQVRAALLGQGDVTLPVICCTDGGYQIIE